MTTNVVPIRARHPAEVQARALARHCLECPGTPWSVVDMAIATLEHMPSADDRTLAREARHVLAEAAAAEARREAADRAAREDYLDEGGRDWPSGWWIPLAAMIGLWVFFIAGKELGRTAGFW